MQKYRQYFVLVDDARKGANAYVQQNFQQGKYPRVGSVRVRVASSTVKSASPDNMEDAYNRWTAWARGVPQVCYDLTKDDSKESQTEEQCF